MAEITLEHVLELERKIAERAQVYIDRPDTRPQHFAVTTRREPQGSGWSASEMSPYAEIEAALEAAARDVAPNWDHMMARYIDRPPFMRLGLYRGGADE